MSILEQMENDAKDLGITSGNSDFFQFEKSGVYRFRILSEFSPLATHFFGKGNPASICYGFEKGCPFPHSGDEKPSLKYHAYAIDRNDGKVKLVEFPYSVVRSVGELQNDEDFKFEGFPMPYDIKVAYDKENNDPKSIYKTLGSPKQVPLTVDEGRAFDERMARMTPEAYVTKRKETQLEKHKAEGIWQREQDRRAKLKADIDDAKINGAEPAIEYPADDINVDDIPF